VKDFRRRILLVDDSKTFQALFQSEIASDDCDLVICNSGQEALDIIAGRYIDFVCSSYYLSDMDGLELCRRVRQLTKFVSKPFVLLTSVDDAQALTKALPAGVTDIFHKRDVAQLLAFIHRFPSKHARIEGRVLYVEDSDSQRAHLQGLMEWRGLKVDAFASAETAWQAFLAREYDLVVTDVVLDGAMSGLAFVNMIRRQTGARGDIPVLAVTAFDDKTRRIELYNLGVTEYIIKPVAEEELFVRIRSLLAMRDLQQAAERKRFQQQENQLGIMASVFANNNDAIIITDAEKRIVNVNAAFTRIIGYAPEEAIGLHPRPLLFGNTPTATYQQMRDQIIAKGGWQGELWGRRKNGELFPIWLSISVVPDASGRIANYVGIITDISERKASEERVRHLAHHDALTHLPNRLSLQERLKQALSFAWRHDKLIAVMLIDLDNFKTINDTLGHQVGDQLLIHVAQRLTEAVRTSDIVARLGGDEFVVVLPEIEDDTDAATVADKILLSVTRPYQVSGHDLRTSPSIGICMYPEDATEFDDLMKKADLAMYYAKAQGRSNYQFFTRELHYATMQRIALENDLRAALEGQLFELHYQPQIDLPSGAISGVEALVRWRHPERGLVPPADFISVAEETGLIIQLGDWVLREACRQLAAWQAAGILGLRISVNLSANQFLDPRLALRIAEILAETGVAAALLELEVTESVSMHSPTDTVKQMEALTAQGVTLSIDDFGTGYSSMTYLKLFPIRTLKIDRSFVQDIETDPNDAQICEVTVLLAQRLGLKTVAEGVETREQLQRLMAIGCEVIQGYLISKPMPADALAAFVRAHDPRAWAGGLKRTVPAD
jgi:diguanylate cyclase (GGDEF)-like protein/PAS domain S-box-containing protein